MRTRAVLFAAAALLVLPGSASAGVTCTFNGGSPPTLEVFSTAGSAVSVVVNGSGVIEVNDGTVLCTNGPAEVTTTDAIVLIDQSGLTNVDAEIDLSGSAFAPGANPEFFGTSEIEFGIQSFDTLAITGSAGADFIRLGAGGINLNANESFGDSDADFGPINRVSIGSQGGIDTVGGQGGAGTGAALSLPLSLAGGPGNDALTGGDGPDSLRGESGDNTLAGGAGRDTLEGASTTDTIDGGPGLDLASYVNASAPVTADLARSDPQDTGGGGTDTLIGVEDLTGSQFADVLTGNAEANLLDGGFGSDTLTGAGGVDTLNGNAGDDSAFARDGGADTVLCSVGTDSVTTDDPGVDSIDASCENVVFDDTIAPDTMITAGPQGTIATATPTFEFASSEAGSTFECRTDLGAFGPCSSPFSLAPLTGGPHAFDVRARDGNGNADATPASASFTVDVPSPDVPSQDTTRPILSRYRLSPSRFRSARRGASIAAVTPVGTRIVHALSEDATVRFTVERASRGRRVGRSCRKPSARNRGGARCTRYTRLRGRFDQGGSRGTNRLTFTGRLGSRALRPGSYRLGARALDAAGNASVPVAARFRIVRR